MDDQGIPYEALSAKEIADRFPLKPKPDFTGLFEPTAGAVRSDKVVEHWIRTARSAGHQLIEHCPVIEVDAVGGSVTLNDGHRIHAGQVVVACGIWSRQLLAPLNLAPKLEIWPMLWAHYSVDPSLADRYPQWFCFQKERGDDGGLYYGFPVLSHAADGRPRIKAGIGRSAQSWIRKPRSGSWSSLMRSCLSPSKVCRNGLRPSSALTR